jgi:hypothetical protein
VLTYPSAHKFALCNLYDLGELAANDNLIAEISEHGLRRTTKVTGLDRKTIRAILNGKKVKASTLAKVLMGFRKEWSEECLVGRSE